MKDIQLDATTEEWLIAQVKGSITADLLAYEKLLQRQNIYIDMIGGAFVLTASTTQKFIADIHMADKKHKENRIQLALSLVKIGLNIINIGAIVDVGEALSNLVNESIENIGGTMPGIMANMKTLVMQAHMEAFEGANVLFHLDAETLRFNWVNYKAELYLHAQTNIEKIFKENCTENDNFYRCLIRAILYEHPELDPKALRGQQEISCYAIKKAGFYIQDAMQGLVQRVSTVERLKNTILSRDGMKCLQKFFEQMALKEYADHIEKTGASISKGLGHIYSAHFPENVAQEKWMPVNRLTEKLCGGVKYNKRKMSRDEYKRIKENAEVRLSPWRTSPEAKRRFFSFIDTAESIAIKSLFEGLRAIELEEKFPEIQKDAFDTTTKSRYGRFSFGQKQRTSIIEAFEEAKPIKKVPASPDVILLSTRPLEVDAFKPESNNSKLIN